ncbi:MAG: adenylate kinase [Oscillibacter sp.]|nr:adenylate kinase [Oscillibacter sp.]
MLNIALFGPPCAGKGTQAKRIVEKYNLAHLSTGDMIRKEIAEGTELGKMAADIINSGQLLSDEFVIKLIQDSMEKSSGVEGFLFDGFPRTVAQAEKLDEMLKESGSPLRCLLSIDVPVDELKRRMTERAKIEGRADDNEEAINNRFKEYHAKTVPVAQHYRFISHPVKGDGTMDEVFDEMCVIIEKVK